MSVIRSRVGLGMRSLGVEVLGKLLFQRQSGREAVGTRGMGKYIKQRLWNIGADTGGRIHPGRIDKTA